MDIIYRIGIPNNVIGLLDNIDIAVGSFQRRFQIVEILMEQLLTDEFEQLFSIAGGSGIIPIEAIIKSRKKIRLINIDRSEKALKKMKVILAQIKKADCLIIPQYIKADISNIVNINALSDSSKIIECTGYLEYLNMNEKSLFLKDIERILNNKDVFILTVLILNPQQSLFERIGFKELYPIEINELIKLLQNEHLHICKIFLTPNDTYATLIIYKSPLKETRITPTLDNAIPSL